MKYNFKAFTAKYKVRRRAGRMSCVWLLSSALFFSSASRAQWSRLTEKVTIQAHQTSMKAVIESLDRQSAYSFTFAGEQLAKMMVTDCQLSNATLGEALAYLQKQYGLEFSIADGNISVKPVSRPAGREQATGLLSGQVLDEENGEPVAGVTINIKGQLLISNAGGDFALSLPPGTYTAEVTGVGYGSKRITDIEIKAGKSLSLPLTLKREKGQLAGVIVVASARKESVNALYVRQKNAATVSDGISAEQISRTPDKNIGESLKRINGLSVVDNKYVVVRGLGERYNGSIVNGQLMPSTELNRKQFSFDIIPASMVENVTVYKTITPDMSAEFGGGLVNVNTRSIPEENFFTITAGGSVNSKTTGKTFRSLQLEGKEYLGSLSDHRKLFGSLDWTSRAAVWSLDKFDSKNNRLKKVTDFTNNWGLYQFKAGISPNFQVSYGHLFPVSAKGGKIGVTAAVSYRNTLQTQDVQMSRDEYDYSDDQQFAGSRYGFTTSIGVLTGIGYQNTTAKVSLQSMYLRNLDQQLVLGQGLTGNGNQLGYYDLTTQTTLMQHVLKGEYAPGKHGVKLTGNIAFTDLNRLRPDNHIMRANVAPGSSLDQINIFGAVNGGFESISSAGRWWNRTGEKSVGWDMNAATPFLSGMVKGLTNTVKLGYAGWTKDRFLYVFNTTVVPVLSDMPPLSIAFDPQHSSEVIFSKFGDDFSKKASLHALYGMLDQRLGKLRLVWGVRAEYYNLNKINDVLDTVFSQLNKGRPPGAVYDYSNLINQEKNWQFFPTANLTYGLTPAMNLRLSYAKSIIRPDLRELAYFKEYDFELGGTYESKDLIRSTIIHHYDFRYEWFPSPGDVLSFSLFYKQLAYPMEIYKVKDQRSFFLHNNKSAKNKGLEMEVRKSLAFTQLPVVRNITLYSNFTLLRAEVVGMTVRYSSEPDHPLKVWPIEVMGQPEKRPQTGASNYLYNGGLQYQDKLFAFNLSYNYVSNRLLRSAEYYPEALFEKPLNALDAQLAFRFRKQKAELKFNVSNILGSSSIVYWNRYGDNKAPVPGGDYASFPAPTTSQLLYQKGQDPVDYQATPGRTYSFTFNYCF